MSDAYRELGYSGGCQICGSSLHPSQHCAEVMDETRKERDLARKESAALAQLLEQERGRCAALEKERDEARAKANLYALGRDATFEVAEQVEQERDEACATLAALQQRCAKLETVLRQSVEFMEWLGNFVFEYERLYTAADGGRIKLSGSGVFWMQGQVCDRISLLLTPARAALAPDAGSGEALDFPEPCSKCGRATYNPKLLCSLCSPEWRAKTKDGQGGAKP